MNDQLMICQTCRTFIDAGYRWAYWQLVVPGMVRYDQPIDLERLCGAVDYWHPADLERSAWLEDGILPALRQFLAEHATHRLIFGTDNSMDWGDQGADLAFTWMEVGHDPQPTPRYYAEVRGCTHWSEVEQHIEDAHRRGGGYPWWWYADDDRQAAQRAFEAAVTHQCEPANSARTD